MLAPSPVLASIRIMASPYILIFSAGNINRSKIVSNAGAGTSS
jgi:hypothetical protein